MPFADVNGQRIWFEDSGGSGPPLVLAHGFLMDHTMFDPQVAALAPELRVIRWDARAHGSTEWDEKPFTYWDSAADCVALLDHLGLERAAIGGMSQGGFVSLRVALAHPSRVKALVLLDTQAGVDDDETLGRYRMMLDTWLAMGPLEPLVEAIATLILGDRAHWEPWVTRFRATPVERVRGATRCLLERDDITSRLGEIACAAFLAHGTNDASIPMARAEALAAGLAHAEPITRVEGGGHAANLTHPAGVNPALLAFLRRFALVRRRWRGRRPVGEIG